MPTHEDLSNFIWQIADLLRGPYRPPQYERVMLPMVVLRRFECVLEDSKARVLAEHQRLSGGRLNEDALDTLLNRTAGQRFHNRSPLSFEKLKSDPDHIESHLKGYIRGFSANVRTIFEYFEFDTEIEKMAEANILYLVVSRFCDVNLHPESVPNQQMGLLFENLIRRFNELANETAGDHFTPREIIRLMVDILFINDDSLLSTPGVVRKLLDPACGTGGMLAEAQNYMRDHHRDARLYVYGQEYNKRAFATAASDMLMKQVDHNGGGENIRFGDIFLDDRFEDEEPTTFDYLLANPPFGVDWKRQQKEIVREHEKRGFAGRFGAGLPRVNDGSLLFLQHMISKFEPVQPAHKKLGSRLGIVFSGSPLFTGGAGSGESNIRKWIIENDWLDTIIALPEQMFYNTGIGTYVWIVTNRKPVERKGKIQLIDARERWKPLRRSLGDKRRELSDDDIDAVVREYGGFQESDTSKVFPNAAFGYTRLTVERPLRLRFRLDLDRKARFLDALPHLLDDLQAIDAAVGREPLDDWNAVSAAVRDVLKQNGSRWKAPEHKLFRDVFTERNPDAAPVIAKEELLRSSHEVSNSDRTAGLFPSPRPRVTPGRAVGVRFDPDPQLRDYENVPLTDDVNAYFAREILPHVSDAWLDREKDKVGYEINFNRYFYRFIAPRPLEEIDADLRAAEERIVRLLREVTA